MNKIKIFFALCMMVVFFASCASNNQGLIQEDFGTTADAVGATTDSEKGSVASGDEGDNGYVYGRFFLSTEPQPGSFDLFSSNDTYMYGLIVRNVETNASFIFTLEDSARASVQMASLPPGTYHLESLNRLYEQGGEVLSIGEPIDYRLGVSDEAKDRAAEKEANDDYYTLEETFDGIMGGYPREFTVETGKALYLGDFVLYYYLYVQNMGNVVYYTHNTQTYPPLDRFEETTQSLYERYPYMNNDDIVFSSNMDNVTRYLPWDQFFTVYSFIGEKVQRTN